LVGSGNSRVISSTGFFVLIDKGVQRVWGEKINEQLRAHGKEIFTLEIEPTEASKSISYYPTVVGFLEENICNRYDLVIGIGGGIVIDVTSFVVSTYMRGLPLYIVATTLIGQVDASTAGKTCLNTAGSKNLLGTLSYGQKWCLAFSSSGDQIEFCHLHTVFELYSGHHLGQVVEAA
jgi:3-dehydroquinate synthase